MEILTVRDRDGLIGAAFHSASVILLPRKLSGDFNALALGLEDLRSSPVRQKKTALLQKKLTSFASDRNSELRDAAGIVLEDMRYFQQKGFFFELRLERSFIRSDDDLPFHQDRLDESFGRILCSYNDPVTEWIRPENADYHRRTGLFSAKEESGICRFQTGDLWRFAGSKNKNGVIPLIHRAPRSNPGSPPRLLLVADGTGPS